MSVAVVVACIVQGTGIQHDEALWTTFGPSQPLWLPLVVPLATVGMVNHLIDIAVHVVALVRWRGA